MSESKWMNDDLWSKMGRGGEGEARISQKRKNKKNERKKTIIK